MVNAPQWQRWTVTLPAGRHRSSDGSTVAITTAPMTFDAYVPNLYDQEASMRFLVDRADAQATMEYADPPKDVN